jgi:DAK2 domain fusion protein YloV
LCRGSAAGARDLVEALESAEALAKGAVARPVEGTALTVLSEAAGAARRGLAAGGGVASVARAAFEAAREASERTRDMLPELRSAGVVDAGGRGMVLLFDALSAALGDGTLTETVGTLGPVGRVPAPQGPSIDQRYEVMYLWAGENAALSDLRMSLEALGDSVVIVGGGGMYKVHVHTNQPDAAVVAGEDAARDVRVVDLRREVAERCMAGEARAVQPSEPQATALVGVAEGDGVAAIFRSLGAIVVLGGPDHTPAGGELMRAIGEGRADSVLILPNHPTVLDAAERAAQDSGEGARVIPTRSIVEGLTAAAAFNPVASPDENEREMLAAAAGCVSIEVVRASRDSETPAGRVRAGDWLGLVEGDVVALGADPAGVAAKLVSDRSTPDHEILTLLLGADPSEEEAGAVAAALREAAPELDLQVHRGGQPGHPYLIGLE